MIQNARYNMQNTKKGFALVEALLAIAVVTILASFSVPVYQYFQVKNDLDIVRDEIVHSLRRAQIRSQAVDGDVTWGVDVRTGQVTIFKGANYASRDSDYDEVFDVSDNISFSGISEITYSKVFGEPSATGTITLTSVLGDSIAISVNSKGMISY
jgi:type II secretory pathway pseudopilin PulG